MPAQTSKSDLPSWRRGNQATSTSQLLSNHDFRDHHADRKGPQKSQDNWRAHAQPITDTSQPHHGSSSRAQPLAISKPYDTFSASHDSNGPPFMTQPSLLSTSLKREKTGMLDPDWIPGHHSRPDPTAAHAIKPSGMGNGVIGRAPEFGTSPTKAKGSSAQAPRHHWPLSSSLERHNATGPATHLHPLRIGPAEGSRFFPPASTSSKPNTPGQHLQHGRLHHQDADRDDNWMLTPTSSLPSIPSTPNHMRDSSTERALPDGRQRDSPLKGSSARSTSSARGPVEQLQASVQRESRTPGSTHGFTRQEGGFSSNSLFNRGPSVNVHSSPKRFPLVNSNLPHRQQSVNVAGNNGSLSPTSSPKLSHRALSPMARPPPLVADAHTNGERVVNSIASMLKGSSPQPRPSTASRRDSLNSIASIGAGHTMSHSRRSSAVFSPNSPTVSSRIGVYRPPHLRNRGSVSGLKPSVVHYDRVRTPSLRGLSRSRESSLSLSRPTSRPPSTVPFYHTESIPEDGQVEDTARAPLRGRQSNASIHLPDLIAEEQQRNAAAAAAAPTSDNDEVEPLVPDTTHLLEQPLDSASLLAKLRAQLVRREAAASDMAASDMDRDSVITEDDEQEFFDLSEMMEYGVPEGHPLSRYGSTYAIEGHPLGDVFEIGDLLGPGLEHAGHVIQIAETTPGFIEQNADLTGSKLEVIRKLGEGSYAVVYLVKEVSAEEVASHASQKSMSIPTSAIQSGRSEPASRSSEDDADMTMVASSEDLLSTTLKANGKGKEDGFHNSPALEERRRKDLKIDTRLRPGKEYALKCLCKRDLPEDMLEVQRLEATIHQSIPSHPNIVTLYRTYETPDWLFLVLEYCPGQDLYYWLEQAQDTGQPSDDLDGDFGKTLTDTDKDTVGPIRNVTSATTASDNYRRLDSSLDATPPSPSLLASTSGHGLLSKRRIRLVARMFRQICDAVQFCHDRGVSHRDIKPENFIVEDRRSLEEMQSACPDTSTSTLIDSTRDGDDTQVIVKMTDFGLATAEDRCEDFDCGSKPYMAYECHNNVSTSYDPKQADIWSLGIVLLNLLFHRSPFTEPSMNCPSFEAYCQDPIGFLMESFDGLTETVARFLSENVFCSISEDGDASQRRISAGEFSRWACGLVDHMGLSGPGPGRMSRGASIYATIPLVHSRTGSMSTLPSLLSSPRARVRSLAPDLGHVSDLDATADATFRAALASARQGSLSPHSALFTPDVLPSPTFTPSPQPPERNPFESQYGAVADVAKRTDLATEKEPHTSVDSSQHSSDPSSGTAHSTPDEPINDTGDSKAAGLHQDGAHKEMAEEHVILHTETLHQSSLHESAEAPELYATINGTNSGSLQPPKLLETVEESTERRGQVSDEKGQHDDAADAEGDAQGSTEDGDKAESVATSNHSKRRKRGARKGRTLAKQLKRSQSVERMADVDANDPAVRARERERTIRELALASENLARQMSKMTKPSDTAEGPTSLQVVLSKPTAEAAARYNLQNPTDVEGDDAHTSTTGLAAARIPRSGEENATASTAGTNWSSSALRRERMVEQRKIGSSVLQDSGRSRIKSWRDGNQSAVTLSSLASSVTTTSSHSSVSSATSSIYSTASAPAALLRKDSSTRNRTRGSGFALDTISERERTAPTKKEVDARYLAGIFGGGDDPSQDRKRRESATARSGEEHRVLSSSTLAPNAATLAMVEKSDKGNKLFCLLADGGSKVNGASLAAFTMATSLQEAQRSATDGVGRGAGQRSVSVGSTTSNSSSSGVAASLVSRFRRPGSSASTAKPVSDGESNVADDMAQAQGRGTDKLSGSDTSKQPGTSLGMRRDASTSTSSLHRVKDESAMAGALVVPNKSNSKVATPVKSPSEAGTEATAPKKRGMGKFLLGVRDSIKNF